MSNYIKKGYLLPIYLTIAFFLDGSLAQIASPIFFLDNTQMISRLLMILFICVVFLVPEEKNILIYAIVFGFLYDLFYTSIFGVYIVAIPLIIWLAQKMASYLPTTVMNIGFVVLICLTIMEVFIFAINVAIGFTQFSLVEFIQIVLAPSIALNMVYFVLGFWLIKRLLLMMKA